MKPTMKRGERGCGANGLMIIVLLVVIGAIFAWGTLRTPDAPLDTGPTPETLVPADPAPPLRTP
jgi:hypothetical protein